ncbi:GCN5-related N-acetyltransferase [Calothrix sp. NIES-4071]|nr:GCN5-related N-acetyltransferase [Calothrix sp. NIES-4071]BAZ60420.1 GCN5-related N-acetyltransferase [Calothrix sp. NIES-4105]
MLRIEKLSNTHNIDDFDCGSADLNRFLQRYALQSIQSNSAQTYVACLDEGVIGFYSLAVGSVMHDEAPTRVTKGLAKHPIPVMILARLAVSTREQGKGIGKGLLKDALKRTYQAADIAGIRALLVHAKDDEARAWYEKFDFEASPTDPLHLFLLMKDIKKILQS